MKKRTLVSSKAANRPMKAILFSELPVHQYFVIPGYDDLFRKVDSSTAQDEGCGFLTKPTRFARKYARITVSPTTLINPR